MQFLLLCFCTVFLGDAFIKATSAREKESIGFQSLIILALGLDKNIEAETGFAEFQGCFSNSEDTVTYDAAQHK